MTLTGDYTLDSNVTYGGSSWTRAPHHSLSHERSDRYGQSEMRTLLALPALRGERSTQRQTSTIRTRS
jgi:hypothetical protein